MITIFVKLTLLFLGICNFLSQIFDVVSILYSFDFYVVSIVVKVVEDKFTFQVHASRRKNKDSYFGTHEKFDLQDK